MRVKCRFHFTQFCKSSSPKTPGCIQRETFAVFTPQQTTVFRASAIHHQRFASSKSLVADRTYPAPDGRARHLRRRDRTYRSFAVAAEQRAKFSNIIRCVFRRQVSSANGIGLAAPLAFRQADQRLFCASHRYVQHPPARAHLPADHSCLLAGNQLIKPHTECINSLVNQCLIITSKFHNVQPKHLFIRHIGNQLADGMPDNIFPRQIQHF